MYKFGKPVQPNFFGSTRNSVYRQSDNITAKIVPEDLFSILNQNALNPDSLNANDIRTGNFQSDVGSISQLGTDTITAKNSSFIKLLDPVLITNMKDYSDSQLNVFFSDNNIDTSNSCFNIILNQSDIDVNNDILLFIKNGKIICQKIEIETDNLFIKDNITTINYNNNDKIVSGFNMINKISDDLFFNYYLISYQNLTDHNSIGSSYTLRQEYGDSERYKEDSITNEDNVTTSFSHSNLRLVKNYEDINLNLEKFIHQSNNNSLLNNYLPLEIDRLILHHENGNIINPNSNGKISFKIFNGLNSVTNQNNYLDMIILSNTNSTINLPHIQLSKSIYVKKQNSSDISPNFYFDDKLIFNQMNNLEPTSNFIFKIEPNLLTSTKNFYFSKSNLGIDFTEKLNIKLKGASTIDFLVFDSTSLNLIEAKVDFKANRIITDELNVQNINKSSVLNIKNSFNFTGPNNYGIQETTDTTTSTKILSTISEYNTSSCNKIVKISNGIIGKEKYISIAGTTVSNFLDPFPDNYLKIKAGSGINGNFIYLDNILDENNYELKYYIPSSSSLENQKTYIQNAFISELATLSGLNKNEKYIELIKKYFYIEPKENKFINGCLIKKALSTVTSLSNLDNDAISDLTTSSQRITWNYTLDDGSNYAEFYSGTYFYDAFNNLSQENSELSNFIFYIQNSITGTLHFKDIFETFFNATTNNTEYIFENSCSFEGFLSMRENISNNPRNAHFKFNGYFDRNNQKKNVEIIYQPDTIWDISVNGDYDNNQIIVTITHNSTYSILVNCNLKVTII
tara:strand:+ start:617 stop:3007 length:2391 start_codon:yes stop_codon:yes gene_type:complete